MATFNKGILGGFSGKLGTVVGVNWRGKDIMRSLPKKTNRKPSPLQAIQQLRFALAVAFLKPLSGIQSLYFGQPVDTRSRINMATSYTMMNSIIDVDGLPELLLPKVVITKGELSGFNGLAVESEPGRVLRIQWEDNSTQSYASPTDQVTVVCYCEALEMFEILEAVATRDEGEVVLTLSKMYREKDLHVWMYLNDAARKKASTSVYMETYRMG